MGSPVDDYLDYDDRHQTSENTPGGNYKWSYDPNNDYYTTEDQEGRGVNSVTRNGMKYEKVQDEDGSWKLRRNLFPTNWSREEAEKTEAAFSTAREELTQTGQDAWKSMTQLGSAQVEAVKPLQDKLAGVAPLEATQQANRARSDQAEALKLQLMSSRGNWDPNAAREANVAASELPVTGLAEQRMQEDAELEKTAATIVEVEGKYRAQEQSLQNAIGEFDAALNAYDNQKASLKQQYLAAGYAARAAEHMALLELKGMEISQSLALRKANLQQQINSANMIKTAIGGVVTAVATIIGGVAGGGAGAAAGSSGGQNFTQAIGG